MHRYKRGTAKSGPGGRAGRIKSRKQAIAIGLSKARKKAQEGPEQEVVVATPVAFHRSFGLEWLSINNSGFYFICSLRFRTAASCSAAC